MRFELSVRNAAAVIANLRAGDAILKREIKKEVRETSKYVKQLTQFFCPVDTGFMRDHVRAYVSPKGLVFEVGWDAGDFIGAGLAFYPFFVEYGTVKMAARPSLTPAYEEARPVFEENIRAAIIRSVARATQRSIDARFKARGA